MPFSDQLTAISQNPLPVFVLLFGLIALIAVGRELRKRMAERRGAGDDEALPRLAIQSGTMPNRIPAFRARLQWHVARPEPDATALLDDLVTIGLSLSASDIHFTPLAGETTVALRIHGTLYELGAIPAPLYVKLVSRVKVLASMAIYKRATPQDGEIEFDGGRHRARVSVLPTNRGEKVVMRLASADAAMHSVDALGLDADQQATFTGLLNANHGMIVVTGPTGSGKTTTMYAALQHIDSQRGSDTNIVTLEDPIEFDFPRFAQTQIDPASGMTFAVALRSVLRQDPDVILVGEIRDDETAAIAVRAAATGHLIFTTLHAERAAGVFNRIIQHGVERYQVASAVRAVISQRLCQRLCPECTEPAELSPGEARQFAFLGYDPPPPGPYFAARGCDACLGKGVGGRVPVYEMLVVTDAIRDMINDGRPSHQVQNLAIEEGMRTLFEHGMERVNAGEISVSEALRVLAQ